MIKLDAKDHAILDALQRDGRLSNVRLAGRVHLSESACLRRVRLLEQAGMISGYRMIVNQEAVGIPGNIFAEITLTSEQQRDLGRFEAAAR